MCQTITSYASNLPNVMCQLKPKSHRLRYLKYNSWSGFLSIHPRFPELTRVPKVQLQEKPVSAGFLGIHPFKNKETPRLKLAMALPRLPGWETSSVTQAVTFLPRPALQLSSGTGLTRYPPTTCSVHGATGDLMSSFRKWSVYQALCAVTTVSGMVNSPSPAEQPVFDLG